MSVFAIAGLLMWLSLLVLPWQPWRTRERLEPRLPTARAEAGESTARVSVLIPARNEAAVIQRTLAGVARQDHVLEVLLVDDHSTDDTGALARTVAGDRLTLLQAPELPAGWSGKLWALEQARLVARGEWLLLLDADIELAPGMLAALIEQQRCSGAELISLMARLRMQGFWERLLMPPFIFFFKLIYPFALANGPSRHFAAAAGGCLLIARSRLAALGGLDCIRGALIDDCSLAAAVKRSGGRTWIGLTHGAVSLREYPDLASIWNMVSRTAYTQLRYSPALLAVCTLLMLASLIAPGSALLLGSGAVRLAGAGGLLFMSLAYAPVLRYYQLPLWRALTLPVAGALFLAMTWSSALDHHRGRTAEWRGRLYPASHPGIGPGS